MFNKLYRVLKKNRQFIRFLFRLIYLGLFIMFAGAIWAYNEAPQLTQYFRDVGGKFGTISVGLLMITLTPGILKRLGILKQIRGILVLFRKQFGTLTFLTAVMHLGFVSWIKKLAEGQNPLTSIFKYKKYGFGALTIFLLLWLLSNHVSRKLLGRWWLYAQRLVYLAIIFLILHIIGVGGGKTGLILAIFLGVEFLSWAAKWVKLRKSGWS